MTLASGPIRARRRSRWTAVRIWRAAFSGLVMKARSKSAAALSGSPANVGHARVHAGVARDVGLDPARVDGRHRDLGALDLELHAQRVGEAADGELGRVVGRLRGDADQAEHAGEVDDVTLAGRLEVGQERLGPVHHAPEVDVHQPFEVLVGHGLDRRAQRHAGVVDDQVDRAVVGDDAVGPGVDGVPIGHIEVLGGDLDPEALALRHRLGQARHRRCRTGRRARRAAPARLARARPMPEPAPVIAATRSLKSFMCVRSGRQCGRPAPATGPENSMRRRRCRSSSAPGSRAGSSGGPSRAAGSPAWAGDGPSAGCSPRSAPGPVRRRWTRRGCARHTRSGPVVHVVQQAAHVVAGEVALERPRGVGVAEATARFGRPRSSSPCR